MKNSLKFFGGIILAILIIGISISARISPPDYKVYYVDSGSGNDINNGLTPGNAFQSLDKVNSITFRPGDSILFKANCSWTGKLEPKGSGDASRQIVIS